MKSSADSPPKSRKTRLPDWLNRLGPGLITGASDDDPSGIGTYSQAGAQYAYGLLWTLIFSLPLMAAIQEISARLGRVSGRGIAENIRIHYSRWVLYPIVVLLLLSNIITVGADLGAMGDATRLLLGGPALLYTACFAVLCLGLEVFSSYRRYAQYLKWLCLVLFCYVGSALVVHIPWEAALRGMVIPALGHGSDYWTTVTAVLGTTISPYLFFWQASMETEEIRTRRGENRLRLHPSQAPRQFRRIRIDTWTGMSFSNGIGLFIMLAAAATLHAHGVTDVSSSAQAAEALRPIGGRFAFLLFALGIIGAGMLGLPTLLGSGAYAVAQTLRWPASLDKSPARAKGFNAVLAIVMLLGLAMNLPPIQRLTHLSPIGALFWAAAINGIIAAPVMVVIMLMHHNKKIMGPFTRKAAPLNIVGWIATFAMAAPPIAMFLTWRKH
jgi:NRAMP (natural resistance-associated macrophage protein)-like metal ion transporter